MFLFSPRKALFLFGPPRSGKTTLIESLYNFLKSLSLPYEISGFITKEVRRGLKRVGFDLLYLKDPQITLPLARKDSTGRYRVMPENLDKILELLERDLMEARAKPLLLIDEIGKMESQSARFHHFLSHLWERGIKFVATLGIGDHPFLKRWQYHLEALYVEVSLENRDFLKERLKPEFSRRGSLFVLEGIDGSGKSTLFQALKERLSQEFVFSTEPTSGPYGQKLRELLKGKKASQEVLLELFLKDRFDHVQNLILPRLKEGKSLLLDRYYLSTIAYQGIEFREIQALLSRNETIAPLPDLVLYLEIPVKLALERVSQRKAGKSLFEQEELLQRISENYSKILPLFNTHSIRGDLPLEEVLSEALRIIQGFKRET